MTKTYLLVGSAGSWDDHHSVSLGIFTTLEEAKKCGKSFLKEREDRLEKINKACPIDEEIRMKCEEHYDFVALESLPPEEQEKYHEWWYDKNKLEEINPSYHIYEFEVNKFDLEEVFNEKF